MTAAALSKSEDLRNTKEEGGVAVSDFVSVDQAAKEIGVSTTTFRRMEARAFITFTRFGRCVRVARAEIERVKREGVPPMSRKKL